MGLSRFKTTTKDMTAKPTENIQIPDTSSLKHQAKEPESEAAPSSKGLGTLINSLPRSER